MDKPGVDALCKSVHGEVDLVYGLTLGHPFCADLDLGGHDTGQEVVAVDSEQLAHDFRFLATVDIGLFLARSLLELQFTHVQDGGRSAVHTVLLIVVETKSVNGFLEQNIRILALSLGFSMVSVLFHLHQFPASQRDRPFHQR